MKILNRGLLVESKQKIMPFLVLLAITQAAIIIGKVSKELKSHCSFLNRSLLQSYSKSPGERVWHPKKVQLLVELRELKHFKLRQVF